MQENVERYVRYLLMMNVCFVGGMGMLWGMAPAAVPVKKEIILQRATTSSSSSAKAPLEVKLKNEPKKLKIEKSQGALHDSLKQKQQQQQQQEPQKNVAEETAAVPPQPQKSKAPMAHSVLEKPFLPWELNRTNVFVGDTLVCSVYVNETPKGLYDEFVYPGCFGSEVFM